MKPKSKTAWIKHKKRNISTKGLSNTRKELHQAVQLIGAVGRSYSPESEEDEYGSLSWDENTNQLTSVRVGNKPEIVAGLDLRRFTINLVNLKHENIAKLRCQQNSFKTLIKKLKKHLRKNGFDDDKFSVELPYEIPAYSTAKGKQFKVKDRRYFKELHNFFNNAAIIVNKYKNQYQNASAVRCWPHHFDIATSIVFSGKKSEKQYMGIGFSPGDEDYKRPYYYINLWPAPDVSKESLPKLNNGEWHTENWFGAVLDVRTFKKISTAKEQQFAVEDFYNITTEQLMAYIVKE